MKAEPSEDPAAPFSARECFFSGIALLEFHYPATVNVGRHQHGEGFYSLTLEGGFLERRGARNLEYGRRSASFHPPGDEHALAITGGTRCVSFVLAPEWMQRLEEVSPHKPAHQREVGGPLVWLAARLRSAFDTPSPLVAMRAEGLLLEMLAETAGGNSPAADATPPHWLRRVEQALHDEPGRSLTVRGLAREVGVHPVHLSRTWRRFRRCTLAQSLRQIRIDAARARLADPAVRLVDVAHELGFADQAHFSRVFRRVTGTTPRAYRDALLGRR